MKKKKKKKKKTFERRGLSKPFDTWYESLLIRLFTKTDHDLKHSTFDSNICWDQSFKIKNICIYRQINFHERLKLIMFFFKWRIIKV